MIPLAKWYDLRDLSGLSEEITGWIGADWLASLVSGLLGALGVLAVVGPTLLMLIWVERKVIARFQQRYGPNRVGPKGLVQPVADALKLVLKEELRPRAADKYLFLLPPVLIFLPALLIWGVVPFGPGRWHGNIVDGAGLGGVERRRAQQPAAEIFEPLGMVDTGFFTDPADAERFASIYTPRDDGIAKVSESPVVSSDRRTIYSNGYPYDGPQTYYSGGAGLSSTISDYARFLQALLNGGELDGTRILGRRTVQLMTRDHLAGLGVPDTGRRFGLGFEISRDPGLTGGPRSEGAFGWLGFFNTVYWVDPEEQLVAIIMTQLYPNNGSQLTDKFEVLVYSTILD